MCSCGHGFQAVRKQIPIDLAGGSVPQVERDLCILHVGMGCAHRAIRDQELTFVNEEWGDCTFVWRYEEETHDRSYPRKEDIGVSWRADTTRVKGQGDDIGALLIQAPLQLDSKEDSCALGYGIADEVPREYPACGMWDTRVSETQRRGKVVVVAARKEYLVGIGRDLSGLR